jgi:hypothetical protein
MSIYSYPQHLELTDVVYGDNGTPVAGWVINGAWYWKAEGGEPEFWCTGRGTDDNDSLQCGADAYRAWSTPCF